METRLKTGGRTKGTLNRSTAETKEILQKIVSTELETIPDLLKQLEPTDRVNAIIKLLPYLVPKQQEMAIDLQVPTKTIITVKRREE
jgi:23S rRNA C2498 (ribose-2'-O)-methylase RlmM